MAFRKCRFLFAYLLVLCFSSSLKQSSASERRELAFESKPWFVSLSSLLPSSTCNPYSGHKRINASLEVIHKHGPCSQLKHDKAKAPSHVDILREDQIRVNSIHSKISNKFSHGNIMEELDSTSIPAKSGSVIGSGNYFVTVGLGSPKRDLPLIFDTGSDLTWTQCEPCAVKCYKQRDPTFDPSKSTSYSNINCTSPLCRELLSATGNQGCAKSNKGCVYGIQYGDSSFSVGYFSKERLTITATDVFDGYLFGCGQNNQGNFGGAAGLLGLGRHPISFVQQTAKKYNKIFSYCLPSTPSNVGSLTFGGAASGTIKYTPISSIPKHPSFYGLNVIGITVGGTKLPIAGSVFSSAGAIIDSGTVITRLPPAAYSALRLAFRRGMSKYPVAGEFSILDTCYDLSSYKTVFIPRISFVFGGGVAVELSASGTIYAVSVKQVCLAFAGNEDENDLAIFGNVQQKTLEVVYDVGGGRVGFGPGGCK